MTIPTPPSDLVSTALRLATAAHKGQTRRDRVTPYMEHVRAVMSRAAKDPVSQAVAALHDTLEPDCAQRLSADDLGRALSSVYGADGIDVVDGVTTLTRDLGESYDRFIGRIKSHRGGLWVPVKVADILSNLADTPTNSQIRRYAAALQTLLPP